MNTHLLRGRAIVTGAALIAMTCLALQAVIDP